MYKSLCREIAAEGNTEETVLNTMMYVLKPNCAFKEAAALYDNASKAVTGELVEGFQRVSVLWHLRNLDFKEVQNRSRNLYKNFR